MNYSMFAMFFSLGLLVGNTLNAQEGAPKEKPESASNVLTTEERIAKLVKLGSGVHEIKKDESGEIVQCVIVGQARISTSLGNAKGLEMARDKADLDCSAKFVKWLKEEVSVYQSTEDETIILLEGTQSDSDEGSTLRESGKSIDKNSKKMESTAKGFVRGLTLLHKHSDDKTYTIVKGWTRSNSQAVKKMARDEDDDIQKGSSKSGVKNSKDYLKEDSATSDDADSFFGNPK